MDRSCGRGARRRTQPVCRQRRASPSTDSTDTETDDDHPRSTGFCIRAPSPWADSNTLDTGNPTLGTQSSSEDLEDSDSYSSSATIRVMRRTVPSISAEDEDEDADEEAEDGIDEDLVDEADEDDIFTQVMEDIDNARSLDLFDTGADEDDDVELAAMYDIDSDQDTSEPGEDLADHDHDHDHDWSAESGALTPSEDDDDHEESHLLSSVSSNPAVSSPCHYSPIQVPAGSPSTSATCQRSPNVPTVSTDDSPLAGTLMELLECPVCYEPMQPPIWQCSRGHLVCRDCAPKLRICPTCRCSAQRTRNCTLEKVSSALRYPCRYRHQGCDVRLPPSQLSHHEQRYCPHRDTYCCVQACSWVGKLAAEAAHARAQHASLIRMVQLERPVVMGVSVPTSPGQRVTRILFLVEPKRTFYVHLQRNSGVTVSHWCSYLQEFGVGTSDTDLEYRLDLDEEGATEKRRVRPYVVDDVVAFIIGGSAVEAGARQEGDDVNGTWGHRSYRAKVYSSSEVPDECQDSSRTRCFSRSQIIKGSYISNSGNVKARIIVTLWPSPASRETGDTHLSNTADAAR